MHPRALMVIALLIDHASAEFVDEDHAVARRLPDIARHTCGFQGAFQHELCVPGVDHVAQHGASLNPDANEVALVGRHGATAEDRSRLEIHDELGIMRISSAAENDPLACTHNYRTLGRI